MCIIYIKEYHSIEEKRKKDCVSLYIYIYIDIAALDLEWIAANPSVSFV